MKDFFWKDFAKKYWEKKPTHFKDKSFGVFHITEQDIFEFLLHYSDHCRKNKTTEGLKLYVDGQLQFESELLEALPVAKDKSLKGYHARMSKLYEDYCLVCDELSQGSGEKWPLITEFIRPLYEEIGIPNKYAEIGLYLGNYKKTPFGVHVDGCGVFSFPVVGKKKFRLWEPKFVEKNPDLVESFQYDSYKKQSLLLEVKKGEMAYWPSHAWHIAENDGSFTATWSIGVWLNESTSNVVLQNLKGIFVDESKTIKSKETKGNEKLPAQLQASVQKFQNLSKEELEDTFLRSWLVTKSKRGFKSAPLPRNASKLTKNAELKITSSTFLWAELNAPILCIAVNGNLIELKKDKKNKEFLNSLSSGKTVRLDKIKNAERKLVQRLYENYALNLI